MYFEKGRKKLTLLTFGCPIVITFWGYQTSPVGQVSTRNELFETSFYFLQASIEFWDWRDIRVFSKLNFVFRIFAGYGFGACTRYRF